MSVRIMSLVWQADIPPGEKLVLLALADCASDQGECWPSISTLKSKTNQSERTVQNAVRALELAGHMSREQRPGKGCFYRIHPRNICTPANSAPPQELHPTPANSAGDPRKICTQTIKNHKEPSLDSAKPEQPSPSAKPKKAKPEKVEAERPEDVSEETWRDFKALRARKGAPLTDTALKAIRTQAEKANWSMEAALTECVMRGWQGFKADWVERKQAFGNRGSPETYSQADRDRIRQKYGIAQ